MLLNLLQHTRAALHKTELSSPQCYSTEAEKPQVRVVYCSSIMNPSHRHLRLGQQQHSTSVDPESQGLTNLNRRKCSSIGGLQVWGVAWVPGPPACSWFPSQLCQWPASAARVLRLSVENNLSVQGTYSLRSVCFPNDKIKAGLYTNAWKWFCSLDSVFVCSWPCLSRYMIFLKEKNAFRWFLIIWLQPKIRQE